MTFFFIEYIAANLNSIVYKHNVYFKTLLLEMQCLSCYYGNFIFRLTKTFPHWIHLRLINESCKFRGSWLQYASNILCSVEQNSILT